MIDEPKSMTDEALSHRIMISGTNDPMTYVDIEASAIGTVSENCGSGELLCLLPTSRVRTRLQH